MVQNVLVPVCKKIIKLASLQALRCTESASGKNETKES